jgi:hypothetical protein
MSSIKSAFLVESYGAKCFNAVRIRWDGTKVGADPAYGWSNQLITLAWNDDNLSLSVEGMKRVFTSKLNDCIRTWRSNNPLETVTTAVLLLIAEEAVELFNKALPNILHHFKVTKGGRVRCVTAPFPSGRLQKNLPLSS